MSKPKQLERKRRERKRMLVAERVKKEYARRRIKSN